MRAADPRSLGLLRIAIGSVLIADVLRRLPDFAHFYTNAGMLPNHTTLWQPLRPHAISFFFTLSTPAEALLGLLACLGVFVCFTLGWRTRLFQLLALVCLISLHGRVTMLENGGDIALSNLLFWSTFLPLGRRFSLDAKIAAEANPNFVHDTRPITSLAVLAIILQFGVIYLFNAFNKYGVEWLDGSAVHYAMHQDRIATALAVAVRENLPLAGLQAMTWMAIATEYILAALILTPFLRRYAHRVVLLTAPGLHLSFALFLNLGLFSYAMLAWLPLLLTSEDWDWIARRRGQEPEVVNSDSDERSSPAWTGRLREATVVAFLIACGFQLLNENPITPERFRLEKPAIVQAMIGYPRLRQGWSMFAPRSPINETLLVVDARTVDGRHVDPIAWASRGTDEVIRDHIPKALGFSQFWVSIVERMPGHAPYHGALRDWILRHHERTGNDNDAVVRFEVVNLIAESPHLGEDEDYPISEQLVLRYP